MKRVDTVEACITLGLGYCCERFFWARYSDVPTALIADRLGVHEETVRRHKKKFKAAGPCSEARSNCMQRLLNREAVTAHSNLA